MLNTPANFVLNSQEILYVPQRVRLRFLLVCDPR